MLTLQLLDGSTLTPGTVLPNTDALVATFRAHLSRYLEPIDNYYRRQVTKSNGHYPDETIDESHGNYQRAYSRSSSGVETVEVWTAGEHFNLVKLPYEPAWRFPTRTGSVSDVTNWRMHRLLKLDLHAVNVDSFIQGGPEWTVSRVTAERAKGVPVYRFHYTREKVDPGDKNRKRTSFGYIDANPALSWVMVGSMTIDAEAPQSHQCLDIAYAGTLHGLPAPKQLIIRHEYQQPDGEIRYSLERSTEYVEFVERTSFEASEFTLDHYGLGPPYRLYVSGAATVLVAAFAVHVLLAWRQQRRRRGLTWAVNE